MTDPFSMIQAHAEEQRTQALMHVQNRQNMIHEFLDKLSNEDLGLVGSYTTDLALGAAHEGTYWQGIIEEKLRVRGVCQHCGRDHAEMLLDDEHEPIVPPATEEEVEDIVLEAGDAAWHQPELDLAPEAESNIFENATTWGVYFKDPLDLQGPVICGGCDTEYKSLEDRMLRAPGVKGCGACQQKAKWG